MRHLITLLFFSMITISLKSQTIELPTFNDELEDISKKGITSMEIFKKLDRDLVKLTSSVCANRALMWLYQMEKEMNVKGGKVFLFYTGKKEGDTGRKTWWYHVTPVVNEGGEIIAIDRGFSNIKKPMPMNMWFKRFAGFKTCREIKAEDTDLLKRMFKRHTYPKTYKGENHNCYYIVAPRGYWIPTSVALNQLGTTSSGEPIHFVRDEIHIGDLKRACREAVTTKVGRVLGLGKKKCKKFIGKEHY
jgi:hypothetical protein